MTLSRRATLDTHRPLDSLSYATPSPRITPKTKVILFGYPSNPTGTEMSREDLAKIAELAEKHDLLAISDEIYSQLTYELEHTCFSSLPGMKERTILLDGFSKAYTMTGWRLGYAAGPAELIAAVLAIMAIIVYVIFGPLFSSMAQQIDLGRAFGVTSAEIRCHRNPGQTLRPCLLP